MNKLAEKFAPECCSGMKSQINQSALDFSIQCGWELLDTSGFTAMLGVKFCPWCGLKMPTFEDMLAAMPMTDEQRREQKINWVVGMTGHNPTFVTQVLDNMEAQKCTK